MPYIDKKDQEEMSPVLVYLEADLHGRSQNTIGIFDCLKDFLTCLESDPDPKGLEPIPIGWGTNIQEAVRILKNSGPKHGKVNYLLCSILWRNYLRYDFSYSKLDKAVDILMRLFSFCKFHKGTLFCAASEIYRRLGVPYEIKKTEENGDVFI